MLTAPRVLIVDESEECRAVLSELLARRGAVAVQSGRADQAAELAQRHRPKLIVFDAESDHTVSREAMRDLARTAGSNHTPVIVLGSVRRDEMRFPGGQFVAKPYHYGPLVRTIDELLAAG